MGRGMGDHYAELADRYDANWAYSPSYLRWMTGELVGALRLGPENRIADVGCGTGLYAARVTEQVCPSHPLLCVEPSAAMLRQLPARTDLTPVLASAEDLAEGRTSLPYGQLDACWMKEAVHHLADPASTLRGLAGLLAPGGRLLVVMLPRTIAYPLFPAALARYEELQPDPADIAEHLRAAGLETSVTYVEYELTFERERYLSMVRARYMSLLSTFSDAEIEAGIAEIRAAHPEPVLVFPDRFAFVLGTRGAAGPVEGER